MNKLKPPNSKSPPTRQGHARLCACSRGDSVQLIETTAPSLTATTQEKSAFISPWGLVFLNRAPNVGSWGPGTSYPTETTELKVWPLVRGMASALLASPLCALAAGLSVGGRSPRLLQECLRLLAASRTVGPCMKALLFPLFSGSMTVLPLIAAFGAGTFAFRRCFETGSNLGLAAATREAGRQIGYFHKNSPSWLCLAVEQTLADPGKLGLPL